MSIQPYLFFDGRCDEALKFYEKAIGAKIGMVLRWKDCPDKSGITPQNAEKVMHAAIRIGDSMVLASDGDGNGKPKFEGFSLTLSAKDAAEADRIFAALSEGGEVRAPIGETFFSPRFGMVADKFGVGWMVMVPQ